MPTSFLRPRSVEEAAGLLADEDSRPLAGGQTLVAMMNLGYLEPKRLVWLGAIDSLRGIRRLADGAVRIGAMSTHAELAASRAFEGGQRIVPDAARQIADPGIRHCGTVGGACAHGDPVTDWPPALVAARAVFELVSPAGRREVPAAGFFLGLMTTALAPGELIEAIRIPPLPGNGRFRKLARAEGDFATLSVAAVAALEGGRCVLASLAVGACGPRPVRVDEAEALLVGHAPSEARALQAGRLLAQSIEPLDDVRASAAYRRKVLPHVAAEAFMAALAP